MEQKLFQNAFENLKEEHKEELSKIRKELQNKGKNKITDKDLKNRIAKICLKLIHNTKNNKNSIMETSYVITGNFIWYKYGDQLDEAINLASELELPEHLVTGKDSLKKWEEMKKIFENY